MNLGWIDDDTQYDSPVYKNTGHVVLHEFCHALGMIHEHQNPKGNTIVWNKPVVYAELARTNNWSTAQTDENMFKRYGDRELCQKTLDKPDYKGKDIDLAGYCKGEEVNGSDYDPKSIMHYFYPSSWILEGPKEIPKNTKLSDMDKLWLAKYYGDPKDIVKDNKIIDSEPPTEYTVNTEETPTEYTEEPPTEYTVNTEEPPTEYTVNTEEPPTEYTVNTEEPPTEYDANVDLNEEVTDKKQNALKNNVNKTEQKTEPEPKPEPEYSGSGIIMTNIHEDVILIIMVFLILYCIAYYYSLKL
jgi:hypothetical protein